MNYRTIRYPDHQAIIKALLNDLNLKNRREVTEGPVRKRAARHHAGPSRDLRYRLWLE